ncbi:MAG: GspH/FimT family pseudopilin [Zoogloeaceae bacterium]|nr:GspH/FimT family pseudopilin [Zoogloeaceae bacterium]
MVLKNRVSSSTSEIILALSQARSEAIKRGGFTVLCALDAAGEIDGDSPLTNGWVLLSGTTCKKGPITASTSPLLRHEPLRQLEFCITGACASTPLAATDPAPGSIVFHQLGGVMSAEPVVMVLQPQNCVAGKKDLARRIEINQIGRVRSQAFNCS